MRPSRLLYLFFPLVLPLGLGSCGNATIAQQTFPNPTVVNPPSPLSTPNPNPPAFDPFGNPEPVTETTDTPEPASRAPVVTSEYSTVIERTKNMVNDDRARSLVQEFGLGLMDLTWEDTARYQNSAVGPNISDMTIQVQTFDPRSQSYQLHLMPVIRYPNFEDRSADVLLNQLSLLVGNEKGKATLEKVPLRSILANLREYLHDPSSWRGNQTSLLADRDTHVLVSAQACFLPIPQGDIAQFNPVLFNYQSYAQNPAVLTILATREGTSITVIDNARDGFSAGATWGQRLFFNKNGQRTSLTAQRITDFLTEQNNGNPVSAETIAQAEEKGLNLVLLIQVPLKQRVATRGGGNSFFGALPAAAPALESSALNDNLRSDVETAVIGHGQSEGAFTEIDNLAIERDPNFPIRVTVQFYKGTSNGIISRADVVAIEKQIQRVYSDADYVGSLVTEGNTGRPTEYTGSKQEPPGWWDDFWRRYEANTGQSRAEALKLLRQRRGENWNPRSPEELQQELDRIR